MGGVGSHDPSDEEGSLSDTLTVVMVMVVVVMWWGGGAAVLCAREEERGGGGVGCGQRYDQRQLPAEPAGQQPAADHLLHRTVTTGMSWVGLPCMMTRLDNRPMMT